MLLDSREYQRVQNGSNDKENSGMMIRSRPNLSKNGIGAIEIVLLLILTLSLVTNYFLVFRQSQSYTCQTRDCKSTFGVSSTVLTSFRVAESLQLVSREMSQSRSIGTTNM